MCPESGSIRPEDAPLRQERGILVNLLLVDSYSDQTGRVAESDCILCSAGKYGDKLRRTVEAECRDCGAGFYSSTTGLIRQDLCEPCAAGTWVETSVNDDVSDCIACDPGRYGAMAGAASADSCYECPMGRYSAVGGSSSAMDCTPCPAGRYGNATGRTSFEECAECRSGQSQAEDGAMECDLCTIGKHQDVLGQSMCKDCTAGYYTSVGAEVCGPCAAGKFDDDNDASSSCVDCPTGQYQDTPQASQSTGGCILCAEGRAGASTGADSLEGCVRCPAGSWTPEDFPTGQARCDLCPKGTFRVERAEVEAACNSDSTWTTAMVTNCETKWNEYHQVSRRGKSAPGWDQGCLWCDTGVGSNAGLACMGNNETRNTTSREGTVFPEAAFGYFLERKYPPQTAVSCQPAEACRGGTVDFHGWGTGGCNQGYWERRCAQCVAMGDDVGYTHNGFYRAGGICEKCP